MDDKWIKPDGRIEYGKRVLYSNGASKAVLAAGAQRKRNRSVPPIPSVTSHGTNRLNSNAPELIALKYLDQNPEAEMRESARNNWPNRFIEANRPADNPMEGPFADMPAAECIKPVC